MAVTIEQGHDTDLQPSTRVRREGLLWLTAGVVVVAGAGAGYWFIPDPGAEVTRETTGPAATDEVTRETLSATESWGGTLGHGSPFAVTANGDGVITRVAKQESKVQRGTELYRLNEQPVIAMTGTIPTYRDLAPTDTGIDVKQLETNLAKLGYDGFDVDDEFTRYTAKAVREWQEDIGAEETGVVAQSDVVFMPQGGRIDVIQANVGDKVAPGSEVMEVTGSDQVVSVEVDVADRDLIDVDTDVTVRLPGGEEVFGTVTSSAVVEDTSEDGSGRDGDDEAAGADDAMARVEVTLDEKVDESMLGSPVDVVVDVEEREDVLVVAVNALLALSEGGFGVEVVAADGTTSIIPVDTGLFAGGKVEISGDGIDEGTLVGVAGR